MLYFEYMIPLTNKAHCTFSLHMSAHIAAVRKKVDFTPQNGYNMYMQSHKRNKQPKEERHG